MRVEGGWVGVLTRPGAARATVRSLSQQCTVAGRPHRALQWYTATPQGSGSATRPTLRLRQLLFSAPQSSDKPISSELGLCVRVVAAIAARTIALFSGDRVIGGQMMAPETRSKHGDRSPRLTLKAGRREACKAGH
jgi:hypothetical protein